MSSLTATPAHGETVPGETENGRLCGLAVSQAARTAGVPVPLMGAISLAESGRWDASQRASVAWPWTVMAQGEGQFLPSKAAAIAHVEALRAKGVRNIDVGCMQVNLQYHPAAFTDLDAAFDPLTNATYAAGFLARLQGKSRTSWWSAVGRYHSSTPHLGQRYRAKVAGLLSGATTAATPDAGVAKANAASTARRAAWTTAAATAEAEAETRRAAAEARRQEVIAAYLAKRAARQQEQGS